MKNHFKKKPVPVVDKMREFFETPAPPTAEKTAIVFIGNDNGWKEAVRYVGIQGIQGKAGAMGIQGESGCQGTCRPSLPKDRTEIH